MRKLQQRGSKTFLEATGPVRGTAKVQTPSDPKTSAQGGQYPVQFTVLSLVNILWCQLLYKEQG